MGEEAMRHGQLYVVFIAFNGRFLSKSRSAKLM